MEELELAYYMLQFENQFLRAKGNAFQTFFDDLMSRAYKEDYMPSRPWGNRGDRKNDGFLKSERCLFQVYAPNEMTESEAIKKIDEDFEGAKDFWGNYFDRWAFVHNGRDGLPPHIQKVILELEQANSGVKLELWGFEELRTVFRRLELEDLQTWFGYAPNSQARVNLGFNDIKVVLETIATSGSVPNTLVKQVPARKIESNKLSDSVAQLLKAGMIKASLVEDFFKKWHDPTFGERVASAFRTKYTELKETMTPNQVFVEIQNWVGGTLRGSAEHEMAVLTVIAYYFESCDIFEEPREASYDTAQ